MATEDRVSDVVSAGRGKSQHEAMAAVMARILASGHTGSTATTEPPGRRRKKAEGLGSVKRKTQRKKRKLKNRNTEGEVESSEHDGSEEGVESDSSSTCVHSGPLLAVVTRCHRPPLEWNMDEERLLQRIATRGVVQLFNAVSKQQKIIERKTKEAGVSERKRSKVLKSIDKGSFIDMLKTTGGAGDREKGSKEAKMTKVHSPSSVLSSGSQEQGPAATTAPNWDVLKDGYIMKSRAAGSSMLDWEEGEGGSGSLEDGISSDEQENTKLAKQDCTVIH